MEGQVLEYGAEEMPFSTAEAIRGLLESLGVADKEAFDRFKPEDRSRLVSECSNFLIGDDVVEAFGRMKLEYAGREGMTGPLLTEINEKLRAVNVVARLVYVGKLPEIALKPEWTGREVAQWGVIMAAHCTDAAQLDRNLDLPHARAAHEALRGEGFEAVLASLRAPLALNVDVLSANFSWPMFVGAEGCSYADGVLTMWGRGFEMVCEPTTKAPVYVKDHEAWAAHISSNLKIPVMVVKGSMGMHDWVGCVVSTYSPHYDMSKGVLAYDPLGPHAISYRGPLTSKWSDTKYVIDRLPEFSRSVPPTPGLMSKARIAEYLSLLMDFAYRSDDMRGRLINAAVHEKMVGAYIAKKFGTVNEGWTVVASVQDYMRRAALPGAKLALPVANIIAAADECKARRAEESSNATFNAMMDNSTLTGYTLVNKGAANIAKFDLMLGWMQKTCADMSLPVPGHVDIVGYSSGQGAIPALRRWAPNALYHTYDDIVSSDNPHAFVEWGYGNVYPGTGQLLVDDMYELGKKDLVPAMTSKAGRIVEKQYPMALVKFYVTEATQCKVEMLGKDIAMLLPYGLEKLVAHYTRARIFTPGKAHSPEIYLALVGFTEKESFESAFNTILPGLYLKAALMNVANDFKRKSAELGMLLPMTRHWVDKQLPGMSVAIREQLGWSMGRIPQVISVKKLFMGMPGRDFDTFTGGVIDFNAIVLPASVEDESGKRSLEDVVEMTRDLEAGALIRKRARTDSSMDVEKLN